MLKSLNYWLITFDKSLNAYRGRIVELVHVAVREGFGKSHMSSRYVILGDRKTSEHVHMHLMKYNKAIIFTVRKTGYFLGKLVSVWAMPVSHQCVCVWLTRPRYLQSSRSLRRSVRFLWMMRCLRLCWQNWNRKEVSWLHDSSTLRKRRSRI